MHQIKIANPGLRRHELQCEMHSTLNDGGELETACRRDTMPRGVIGLNMALRKQYRQLNANR